MANDKQATLYRMVLPEHECPHGKRAKELLEEAGYTIDEHILATRAEVDAYKEKEGVATTPQIFIGGKRVGGCDALEEYMKERAD